MRLFRFIAIVVLAMISVSGVFADPIKYEGSLSSGSGVGGVGNWLSNISISWSVTQIDNGWWQYSYTMTAPKPGISHFILEVSPNFQTVDSSTTKSNIRGANYTFLPGNYSGADQANPSMPGLIHGLKFSGSGIATYTLTFQSDRVPVWGDFYAKGGNDSGSWNTGLTYNDTDPNPAEWAASNGSVDNHILVPDSQTLVPEPGSMMALGMGLTGLCAFSLRRRVKRGGE